MKKLTLILLITALLIPAAIGWAQDPPAGSDAQRNACYEGGFLYPCETAYDWQAGWYLQNWIDSGYNPAVQNDLFTWAVVQYAVANPDIFEVSDEGEVVIVEGPPCILTTSIDGFETVSVSEAVRTGTVGFQDSFDVAVGSPYWQENQSRLWLRIDPTNSKALSSFDGSSFSSLVVSAECSWDDFTPPTPEPDDDDEPDIRVPRR